MHGQQNIKICGHVWDLSPDMTIQIEQLYPHLGYFASFHLESHSDAPIPVQTPQPSLPRDSWNPQGLSRPVMGLLCLFNP